MAAIPNLYHPLLTNKERDVLILSAKGCPEWEVAQHLQISRFTVADRLQSIYRKLDVNSKIEAAVWAAKEGWV